MLAKMNIRIIAVLFIVVVLIGLYAALSFNDGSRRDQPTGVLLAAPPQYTSLNRELKPMTTNLAARQLLKSIQAAPATKKFALKYLDDGDEKLLLVDLTADLIYKNAFNANGTIVQTTWRGSAKRRLSHAAISGDLNPEGLEGPSSRNLYH